jgi:hypothetical protein
MSIRKTAIERVEKWGGLSDADELIACAHYVLMKDEHDARVDDGFVLVLQHISSLHFDTLASRLRTAFASQIGNS